MAGSKTYQVSMNLGSKFAMEGKIRDHVIRIDQPKAGGGDDTGPTPLELFLFSLAGCLGALGRIISHQKRIALRGMDIEIQGEIDVDVLLGRTKEPRSGYTKITARVKIDADIPRDEKETLLHEMHERCPVSDNIAYSTPLVTELAD